LDRQGATTHTLYSGLRQDIILLPITLKHSILLAITLDSQGAMTHTLCSGVQHFLLLLLLLLLLLFILRTFLGAERVITLKPSVLFRIVLKHSIHLPITLKDTNFLLLREKEARHSTGVVDISSSSHCPPPPPILIVHT
jgi:hypothetical protein